MRLRAAASVLLAAAALLAAPAASADDARVRGTFDFAQVLREGARWILSRGKPPPPPAKPTKPEDGEERPPRVPFVYPVPQVAMIARDWQGGYSIAGRRMVTDQVRPSRASRLVLARVGFAFGDWLPYAQAGAGLWRADREAIPLFVADTEYAAQLGAGTEVKIAKRGYLGVECDYTIFYREGHEPQSLPMPSVVAVFAALRAEF